MLCDVLTFAFLRSKILNINFIYAKMRHPMQWRGISWSFFVVCTWYVDLPLSQQYLRGFLVIASREAPGENSLGSEWSFSSTTSSCPASCRAATSRCRDPQCARTRDTSFSTLGKRRDRHRMRKSRTYRVQGNEMIG